MTPLALAAEQEQNDIPQWMHDSPGCATCLLIVLPVILLIPIIVPIVIMWALCMPVRAAHRSNPDTQLQVPYATSMSFSKSTQNAPGWMPSKAFGIFRPLLDVKDSYER